MSETSGVGIGAGGLMPEQAVPVYSKLNASAELIVAALQLHGWDSEAVETMNAALLCDRAEQAFQHEDG